MKALKILAAVAVLLAMGGVAQARLLIADKTNNRILNYHATTGAYHGVLVDLSVDGYTSPTHMEVGPDSNLYVQVSEGVVRYNATTGAYVDQLTTTRARAMTLGDDGMVYLGGTGADVAANEVYEVNPTTKVASLLSTLTNPKWPGAPQVDHNIFSLSMADASTVLAMDDPSAWNVATAVPTDGSATYGYYGYLQNFYTNYGNDHTATRWYYNRGNDLISIPVAQGSYYDKGGGDFGGIVADTGVLNGAVRTSPYDGLAYYVANEAGGAEVRMITFDDGTTATVATLLTDAGIGQAYGLAWQPPHPGDANKDELVDSQDFSVLKAHFGQDPAEWEDGNFNSDTVVDTQDFSILKGHFGHAGAPVPTAPAPEPATLSLLALGSAALLISRRRTR